MQTREILFLINGKIEISEVGMAYDEFQKLYASDKNPHKKFFKDCIRALFFVYSMKSPLPVTSMPLEERIAATEKQWIDRKYFKLRENKYFVECEKTYFNNVWSKERKLVNQFLEDIAQSIDRLKNVPWTIKTKGYQKQKDEAGNYERLEYEIEIDNSDARFAAYNNISKLLDLQEKMKKKISFDDFNGNKKENQRIFEIDKSVPPDTMTYAHIKLEKPKVDDRN
jgi:hypothetical protein